MSQPLYFKPNIIIEPLVDSWYAWPHLISPATAARNICNRHLKIMHSYVQAPQIHEAATRNPKMKGGPFMDFTRSRVQEVKELIVATQESQRDMIEFSEAMNELNALLQKHEKGHSLEPLYARIPECLKGYVELVYDLNNYPGFRFYESLLYYSKFYKPASQSIVLWETNNDERPFVLSTPRLKDDGLMHLSLPFKSEFIDIISSMKRTPRPIEDVLRFLSLTEEEKTLFRTFFTAEAPPKYQGYLGDKIRMRYFGHASILIETKNKSILIDPIISYYGYDSSITHYSDADLPDTIDYVLLTHNHQDHILFETLLPLRHKVKNIIVPATTAGSLQDPNLKLMLHQIGFKDVIEIGAMESVSSDECSIIGLPFIGEHSDLNINTKSCYCVMVDGIKILFFADSCNIQSELYQHIYNVIGKADVMFLGMECDGAPLSWLYGPLLFEALPRDVDNGRRLAGSNYNRGIELVKIFNPDEVYVYAMGQEPWIEFISSIKYTEDSHPIVASNKLIEECIAKGIVAERLFGEKELLYKAH